MNKINMMYALPAPSVGELTSLLTLNCEPGKLYKIGSCFEDQLNIRPFNKTHYNETWFSPEAYCLAYGITTKKTAASLESVAINHLKNHMQVGVNVKGQDDVPHDAISAARPQAIYLKPVVPRITSRSQFKEEHISEYKRKNMGVPTVTQQRLALGLTAQKPHAHHKPHKPHKPHKQHMPRDGRATQASHDGGIQPKKHVHMHDDDFVSGLLLSGIPLYRLNKAFTYKSSSYFNKLLGEYWCVPEIAHNLSRLFGGSQIRGSKFHRIKPVFELVAR